MNTYDCYITVEYMYKRYLTHVEQYADACIVRQILRRTYAVRLRSAENEILIERYVYCMSYAACRTVYGVHCTAFILHYVSVYNDTQNNVKLFYVFRIAESIQYFVIFFLFEFYVSKMVLKYVVYNKR